MSNPGNIVGGHKANLNNPTMPAAISFVCPFINIPDTSEEAKQDSSEALDQEFNGSNIDSGDPMEDKNPGNVLVFFYDSLCLLLSVHQ